MCRQHSTLEEKERIKSVQKMHQCHPNTVSQFAESPFDLAFHVTTENTGPLFSQFAVNTQRFQHHYMRATN